MTWSLALNGYLALVLVGFLPSEVWRWLGVLLGRSLDEESEVVLVAPRPYRAFQGWRYLAAKDAPPDLDRAAPGAADMPETLRRELRDLGLL